MCRRRGTGRPVPRIAIRLASAVPQICAKRAMTDHSQLDTPRDGIKRQRTEIADTSDSDGGTDCAIEPLITIVSQHGRDPSPLDWSAVRTLRRRTGWNWQLPCQTAVYPVAAPPVCLRGRVLRRVSPYLASYSAVHLFRRNYAAPDRPQDTMQSEPGSDSHIETQNKAQIDDSYASRETVGRDAAERPP